MKSYRSSFQVGLLVLVLGAGVSCKKEEAPKPEPAPEVPSARPARHNPRMPGARLDPQTNKEHRVDSCYYGTFSLRQARDAYLASLGKDEPSAKKIPSFGAPPPPPAATAPSSSAAAKPAPPTKPAGSGAASAGPAATPPDRRLDAALRLPHERNARSCTAALALKEQADAGMTDIDAQMAVFAPFAVELAKEISMAQNYYQQQEYTKDAFAKGKELDKKLRESFAKLDDLSEKLGATVIAYHQAHPVDLTKMEDGEKLSLATVDAARDVFLLVSHHKAEGEAWKAAVEKLEKSYEALKGFADGHPSDIWGKIMTTAAEPVVKTAKSATITPAKGFDSDTYLTFVNNFTSLLDGRLRSLSRTNMSRPTLPVATGTPAAPTP